MPSSTFIRQHKDPREMTTEEIRQIANKQGLDHYRAQFAANPQDQEARANYLEYCEHIGENPDPEIKRLYKMDTASLQKEWETKGKSVEEAELEAYRDKNAKVWVVSQPRYIQSPENADKLIACMNRLGMRGSIADLQMAFEICVERGEIEAPAEPIAILTEDEMRALPLDQLRAYTEKMNR